MLEGLRGNDRLVERRPGVFYRNSRAFCHFHVDDAGLFADARLDGDFERFRVTTVREQRAFLSAVRASVTVSS